MGYCETPRLVALALIAVALAGCVQPANAVATATVTTTPAPTTPGTLAERESVSFLTRDGVSIRGTYYPASLPGRGVVLLLHMLSSDRRDWESFVPLLRQEGFAVLSVDSRGHGESIMRDGRLYRWQSFSEQDFQSMTLDVEAAKEFLRSHGATDSFVIMGASVGANTALRYAAQDKEVRAVVALSPGLDYRGIKIEPVLPRLRAPLYVAAARSDAPALEAAERIRAALPEARVELVEGSQHGTRLFNAYPDLGERVVRWLGGLLMQ